MSKNFSMYDFWGSNFLHKMSGMSNQRPQSVVEFKNSNNQKSGLNIDKDSCVCDACNYNETKKLIGKKGKKN